MRFLRALTSKITWERVGILSFLLFFLLTPLTLKIRVGEGIFVEPLIPFLPLSALFLVLGSKGNLWHRLKAVVFPNRLVILLYLLLLILFLSFFYGWALTGIFSGGDFLRLFKYGLYFLVFPLAIYTGQTLGTKGQKIVLGGAILAAAAVSALSLWRIYAFVSGGGILDFWNYNPEIRSVGLLGQYLDPRTWSLGVIPKAAHATFGLYLGVLLGMALVFLTKIRQFSWRWWAMSALAAAVWGAILYALSRGAFIVGATVFLAWAVAALARRKFLVLAVVLAAVALGSVFLMKFNPEVLQKLSSTVQTVETAAPPQSAGNATGESSWLLTLWSQISQRIPEIKLDKSAGDRVLMWQEMGRLLTSRWDFAVFGVGYSVENIKLFTEGRVVYPHSLFLDVWARGGLTALALILVVWGYLFWLTFKLILHRESWISLLGTVLLGYLAGWFVDNAISGEQFFSDAPMLAFWGVLGLTWGWVASLKPKDQLQILTIGTTAEIGGGPRHIFQLLSHLDKNKFRVVLAVPKNGPYFAKFESIPGVVVEDVAVNRLRIGTLWKLLRLAAYHDVDLIHSHGKGAGVYSRLVGFLTGKKVVHTWHGIHYLSYGWLARRIYLLGEKLLALLTTRFINVSRGERSEAVSLGLYPMRRAVVIPNGIDPADFQKIKVNCASFRRSLGISKDDLVFVDVARFHPQKGHEFLIRTLPPVLENLPSAKFVMVGVGERLGEMKKLARKLRVSESCVFAGEREDVAKILACSDVFVSPSAHEGMPLAVMEAMASGLPVVATKVVGNEELLQGVGVLVEFGDERGFARALVGVGRNARRRHMLGARGLARVKKDYSLDRTVRSVERVYSSLC